MGGGAIVAAFGAQAATVSVTCPGQTIQAAVDAANPGDVINVTGTCNENVVVRNEKSRFVINGGGTATVNGATTAPVFHLKGKGIKVTGFTITGGLQGVAVSRGANALIDSSNISGAQASGIHVREMSFATITNNTIHNNGGRGILVHEGSVAHIGFNELSDATMAPNTITSNTMSGIGVFNHSVAYIVSNTVSSNGIDGIHVVHGSHAVASGNTVNSNTDSGVALEGNSEIELGQDSGTDSVAAFDAPNVTTTANGKYGIKCTSNSAVNGHLGSTNQLNGTLAQFGGGSTLNTFAANCQSNLVTP